MTANQIAPETAVDQYIQSKHDVLPSTLDNHRYRLQHFVSWADQADDVGSIEDLRGFHLERYKNWRLDKTDCNLVTLEQSFHTLRVFLRWCEKTELIDRELSDKVIIPKVSAQDKARDEAISHDRATEIIDYLCRFQWASNEHIAFHTLYHCGMRRSGLHSLDVDDWHPEERYLSIRNRPDRGTRLKLGDRGERNVSVTDDRLVTALTDYIEKKRPDVDDDQLERIAGEVGGSARFAVQALRSAVELGLERGRTVVEAEDIDDSFLHAKDRIRRQLLNSLSKDYHLVYQVICEADGLLAKEILEGYQEGGGESESRQAVLKYRKKLARYDLIEKAGDEWVAVDDTLKAPLKQLA